VWKAAGKPSAGLLFPAMRDGKTAKAGKDPVTGLSEADAPRRLYKRSHGIEAQVIRERVLVDKRVKAGKRTVPVKAWEQVREPTERELLILDGSDRLAPVCFHSNRNAFAQAADAAGLAHEQTRELLDHENVAVTKGYLRTIGARAKVVPNVHALRPVATARLSSAPVGNIECSQDGHIENGPEQQTKKNPEESRGSWLRGLATRLSCPAISRCCGGVGAVRGGNRDWVAVVAQERRLSPVGRG